MYTVKSSRIERFPGSPNFKYVPHSLDHAESREELLTLIGSLKRTENIARIEVVDHLVYTRERPSQNKDRWIVYLYGEHKEKAA